MPELPLVDLSHLPPLAEGEVQKEFLLAEYGRLCEEIKESIKHTQRLPEYAVIGSALLWAWFADKEDRLPPFVLLISLLLTVGLWVHYLAGNRDIMRIGTYLMRIEQRCRLDPGLGWETQLHAIRRPYSQETWTQAAFGMLLVLNASIAAYGFATHSRVPKDQKATVEVRCTSAP